MANKLTSVVQSGTNNYLSPSLSFNRHATDFFQGGIVGGIGSGGSGSSTYSGSLAPNAQGTPNMTIAIASGQAYVAATPTGGTAQNFGVTSDASENVTISANSSGSTRYSFIYLKLDADKLNNPSVTALDVATYVEQVSTTNGIDSNAAPANSLLLAIVTVVNNATSISASSIADRRTIVSHNSNQGWIPANETWTYVSASTFTVASDVSTKYAVGDKLRWRSGTSTVTYRYAYVVSVGAYSGATTTITITGGTDYSLTAAEVVYDNSFSRKVSPVGFPQWFNYTPTWTGFSSSPAVGAGQIAFNIVGRMVTYILNAFTDGTANNSARTITVPVTSSASCQVQGSGIIKDSGTTSNTPGNWTIGSSATTATLYGTYQHIGWSTSGNSNFNTIITYPI